jgi:hypothetical protein
MNIKERFQNLDKDSKSIIYCILVIVLIIGLFFVVDYFQTKNLLKNGVHTKAIISAKYYEINTDNDDTVSYSIRAYALIDEPEKTLNSYVKQASYNKYNVGDTVEMVYNKEDKDHAKLVEDIE